MERAGREVFPRIFKMMEQAFPPAETRDRQGQESLFDHPAYRLYVSRDQTGQIQGFIAAWEFEDFRFVEHLAVDAAVRGGGQGGAMMREYLGRDPRPVVLEVEPPLGEMARRRIGFYERLGFALNRFDYRQLPLRKGDGPMPLLVMSWPQPVTEQAFAPYKRTIYREVYGQSK